MSPQNDALAVLIPWVEVSSPAEAADAASRFLQFSAKYLNAKEKLKTTEDKWQTYLLLKVSPSVKEVSRHHSAPPSSAFENIPLELTGVL